MKLLNWLEVLITPNCWMRNDWADKAWDKELNKLLDTPTFTEVGDFTVKLNGVTVWIANYPYAYGAKRTAEGNEAMPKRTTNFRLRNKLRNYRERQKEERWQSVNKATL